MEPKLYLCPTPIGNLEDMPPRALRILREADAVYCEDTRNTGSLLKLLGISRPLLACHRHNEREKGREIARRVLSGEAIAYVSDAGLPGISDPGEILVQECIAAGAEVDVLPGPSAALTALVLSGLPTGEACFVGFLPRSGKERREAIARLARHRGSLIIYESPLRASATAAELAAAWGDRPAALTRELTKLHQQAVRSSLSAIAEAYADTPPKGETVLVVGGAAEQPAGEGLDRLLTRLLSEGVRAKDAAKQASALLDIPRNEAYRRVLELTERE